MLSNVNTVNFIKNINSTHSVENLTSNNQCGRFPQIFDLNISDISWQVTNTSNGTFYLFNAYYDDRKDLENGTVVRILAFINKINPQIKTFCQMWFENFTEPDMIEVYEYRMAWRYNWGNNTDGTTPYLLSCKIPQNKTGLVPQFVSFTENRCDAANNLFKVKNKRPKNGRKKLFLVSVKQFDFDDDISMQIIEWFEILKIFGVDQVEIFIIKAHKNVKKILQFYQTEKFVTVKFMNFPHENPNKFNESILQFMQNDQIPYHDSLYENLYMYEYIIPMDVDEFIIPIKTEDRTWEDLIKRTISSVNDKNFEIFPVTNRFFLLNNSHENETYEGIPKNLLFLSNIYRVSNITINSGTKTFMQIDRILIIHNHFPLSCIKSEWCKRLDIKLEDGQLSHYRKSCNNRECVESRMNPVKDTTLWKYKNEILKNVNETLENLKSFKSDID
ncbi:hypothetical protein PVAND_016732 [Polypedilum vanderplanki]|uniref:Glycosyltransferase family 92 protein n=1 Tax=Polypedilum vanderplanki TaxID=319348 RepID=A0A9J6BGN2_POLVA|nr:hypothetical protein PVAND_016732 [Polypedilum vanderplanki]